MITLKTKDWSGKLYIDGEDAFKTYGLFVLDGELKSVVQMPSFKKFDTTEWDEYDGMECDLSEPTLASKNVQIQFGVTNVADAERLLRKLSNGAYHTFSFAELGKSYTLRLSQNGSFDSLLKLGKIKLTFADDFPTLSQTAPYDKTEVTQTGYAIDGVEFNRFGVWVLKGSDDSIRKFPQVRNALSTDIRTQSGLIYDNESVRFKSKDATLKCLINCGSIDEFWKRWNMLFSALTSPELKLFYFAGMNDYYDCYYKSNSVSKFKILKGGRIWCEFNLVLCLIEEHGGAKLADEANNYVVTEDSTETDYTTISINVED